MAMILIVAVAVFFFSMGMVALARPEAVLVYCSGVLVVIAVALYGMAAGRLVSALLEGVPGFSPWLFLGVEVGLASALLGAWYLG